ncbi:retinin-like [Cochliomyia hominivorax]
MNNELVFVALFCLVAVSAHHIVEEPVLAKVGSVAHSVPSAVSHQSFTRYHNKAVIFPVVAPIAKTTVHAAPLISVVKSDPLVHTYETAPAVHSVPVVHAAPVLHAAPAAYTLHH